MVSGQRDMKESPALLTVRSEGYLPDMRRQFFATIFFVKLNFSSQIPSFSVLMPGSGSINNVYLRQKNTKFGGGGEKLGFQI